ncbi:EMILIN-3-like [Megalops cyprinoides]|uniref:EMILIN-3-like n=1 Tax=Megalops cyprinoides TaxID=118141 RepID=UPI0018644A0C|nr:EMILIN-3-like [Megalops cyprinoides]
MDMVPSVLSKLLMNKSIRAGNPQINQGRYCVLKELWMCDVSHMVSFQEEIGCSAARAERTFGPLCNKRSQLKMKMKMIMVFQFAFCSAFAGIVLSLGDATGSFYNGPNSYSLYKSGDSSHFTAVKPTSRHKNYCAYVVEKKVSCVVQAGSASYVKAEYNKCAWGQNCPSLMYRMLHKPQYKVGYKTVTELEWRCCHGYSGPSCDVGPAPMPGKSLMPHPGMKGHPWYQSLLHPPQKSLPSSPQGPKKSVPGGHPKHSPAPTKRVPTGEKKPTHSQQLSQVDGERLNRIEEDVRRLSQRLQTLSGTVAGLEGRLRLSLREDANAALGAVFSGTTPLSEPSVGFGTIPAGTFDGLDGGEGFPGLGDLVGTVTEVKDKLKAQSTMLEEVQSMVLGHDGQLKHLLEELTGRPAQEAPKSLLEEMLNTRLPRVRAEILAGLETQLTGAETRCQERLGEVQQQCHRELVNGQEQMQLSLDGSEADLRKDLGVLQAQVQDLTMLGDQASTLAHRVLQLEESIKGLTESQRQLQNELSGQAEHTETLLQARLEDIEARLNGTQEGSGETQRQAELDGFVALLEGKLKTLEERLIEVVDELSNVTAPALLHGQAVPALETEVESLRQRLEVDVDRVQKQLVALELLCSSCSKAPDAETAQPQECCEGVDVGLSGKLDSQMAQLQQLNSTLQGLLKRVRQQEEEKEGKVQGEITLLKISFSSVNHTLTALKDSVGLFAQEASHANASWHQHQDQLAGEVQGVTQLVDRQGALLGAGERRLAQLKRELRGLKRRLAGGLQGCRSTAQDVQKEVTEMDGRVTRVEGQCSSLGELADHLERIREELEIQSDAYLSQVNGTLTDHSQQLVELREGLKECTGRGDQ